MAMISCPKCGQLVSSSAKVCSNCGFDLAGFKGALIRAFNSALHDLCKCPKERLIASANNSRSVIMEYLYSIFDRKTAAEIFMSFVAICFAADGSLSFDEYRLLLNIVETDGFSFDTCANLVQRYLQNDVKVIDEVIIHAPRNIKEEIANLCITIAAIDGVISVDEQRMCYKYYVLAF